MEFQGIMNLAILYILCVTKMYPKYSYNLPYKCKMEQSSLKSHFSFTFIFFSEKKDINRIHMSKTSCKCISPTSLHSIVTPDAFQHATSGSQPLGIKTYTEIPLG